MNMQSNIVWLSVDPVRQKVDLYPKQIAIRIEESLNNQVKNLSSGLEGICILGKDFFNATIHFNNNGNYYQTTPGYSLARNYYKQPGYRSVRRMIVPDNKKITVFTKFVVDELRITNDNINFSKKFDLEIPDCLILSGNNIKNKSEILPWNIEDLHNNLNLETNVVIWQWCKGVQERQGNLIKLSDDWWEPYLYEQNLQIEDAFINNKSDVIIKIPINNTERKIEFTENSIFGIQKDTINDKQRLIRRKIVTIQELIELIDNIKKKPIDVTLLNSLVTSDEIPYEFFCTISQDIMVDPVKTVDGFTYDRFSIEKWFNISTKSPLTGLNLLSKTLIPNTELKQQIEEFTKMKLESYKNDKTI